MITLSRPARRILRQPSQLYPSSSHSRSPLNRSLALAALCWIMVQPSLIQAAPQEADSCEQKPAICESDRECCQLYVEGLASHEEGVALKSVDPSRSLKSLRGALDKFLAASKRKGTAVLMLRLCALYIELQKLKEAGQACSASEPLLQKVSDNDARQKLTRTLLDLRGRLVAALEKQSTPPPPIGAAAAERRAKKTGNEPGLEAGAIQYSDDCHSNQDCIRRKLQQKREIWQNQSRRTPELQMQIALLKVQLDDERSRAVRDYEALRSLWDKLPPSDGRRQDLLKLCLALAALCPDQIPAQDMMPTSAARAVEPLAPGPGPSPTSSPAAVPPLVQVGGQSAAGPASAVPPAPHPGGSLQAPAPQSSALPNARAILRLGVTNEKNPSEPTNGRKKRPFCPSFSCGIVVGTFGTVVVFGVVLGGVFGWKRSQYNSSAM